MRKEISWWDNKYHTDGRNPPLVKYTKQFRPITEQLTHAMNYSCYDVMATQISGDFSPTTAKMRGNWESDVRNYDNSTHDHVARFVMPHKVRHLIPSAKIIFTLRNPSDRLNSKYNKRAAAYAQRASAQVLHEIVTRSLQWFNTCRQFYDSDRCILGNQFKQFSVPKYMEYLRPGCYSVYIRKWMEVFPKQQLLFLKFEDYVLDPIASIEKNILPFLGLDPFNTNIRRGLQQGQVKNKARLHVRLRNDTRKLLDDFYYPFNRDLETILGKKFSYF